MKARLIVALFPLAALAAVVACGKKKPAESPEPPVTIVVTDAGGDVEDAAPAPKPLYERLGGADGIKNLVDKVAENVTQDPAVNKAFKKTTGAKLEAFKKQLTDQLCELTGGPCEYHGKDMKTAHKGMKITEAQFDSFVNDLKLALAELHIEEAEQNELVEKLAPMKEDIVEVKSKAKK
jgi:hemoglobin